MRERERGHDHINLLDAKIHHFRHVHGFDDESGG